MGSNEQRDVPEFRGGPLAAGLNAVARGLTRKIVGKGVGVRPFAGSVALVPRTQRARVAESDVVLAELTKHLGDDDADLDGTYDWKNLTEIGPAEGTATEVDKSKGAKGAKVALQRLGGTWFFVAPALGSGVQLVPDNHSFGGSPDTWIVEFQDTDVGNPEKWDNGGFFAFAASKTNITIKKAGVYLITVVHYMAKNAVSDSANVLKMLVDGAAGKIAWSRNLRRAQTINASWHYTFAVGEVVTFTIDVEVGGAQSMETDTGKLSLYALEWQHA